jgi:hypothetical protein
MSFCRYILIVNRTKPKFENRDVGHAYVRQTMMSTVGESI